MNDDEDEYSVKRDESSSGPVTHQEDENVKYIAKRSPYGPPGAFVLPKDFNLRSPEEVKYIPKRSPYGPQGSFILPAEMGSKPRKLNEILTEKKNIASEALGNLFSQQDTKPRGRS